MQLMLYYQHNYGQLRTIYNSLAHVRGVGVGLGHASLLRTVVVGALNECFVGGKSNASSLVEMITSSQPDGPRTDEIFHQSSTDDIVLLVAGLKSLARPNVFGGDVKKEHSYEIYIILTSEETVKALKNHLYITNTITDNYGQLRTIYNSLRSLNYGKLRIFPNSVIYLSQLRNLHMPTSQEPVRCPQKTFATRRQAPRLAFCEWWWHACGRSRNPAQARRDGRIKRWTRGEG